jgi:hypothetical protein
MAWEQIRMCSPQQQQEQEEEEETLCSCKQCRAAWAAPPS